MIAWNVEKEGEGRISVGNYLKTLLLNNTPVMYNQTNQLKLRPISQVILKYLACHRQPVDAETIWLDVKAEGSPVSIGSVYGHLKKLTDEGMIIQVPKVNRKTLYQYISSNV